MSSDTEFDAIEFWYENQLAHGLNGVGMATDGRGIENVAGCVGTMAVVESAGTGNRPEGAFVRRAARDMELPLTLSC